VAMDMQGICTKQQAELDFHIQYFKLCHIGDRNTNYSKLNGSGHPSYLICSEILEACSFCVLVFLQTFEF
jgi:hypothetical protein